MESTKSLKAVEIKFKEWRSNRKGRKKIPGRLLKEIVNLPPDISVNKIHKTLSLDWNKVKNLRSQNLPQKKSDLTGSFIEILPPISNPAGEIVFEKPDGSKMFLHVDGRSEVETLLRLFLEQSK